MSMLSKFSNDTVMTYWRTLLPVTICPATVLNARFFLASFFLPSLSLSFISLLLSFLQGLVFATSAGPPRYFLYQGNLGLLASESIKYFLLDMAPTAGTEKYCPGIQAVSS